MRNQAVSSCNPNRLIPLKFCFGTPVGACSDTFWALSERLGYTRQFRYDELDRVFLDEFVKAARAGG